jgi:hypothetical protein
LLITMHDRLREIHAACLPFVTRALRGSTRRRVMLGSALLTLVVLLLGAYIGRSPSSPAHDLRVSLELETSRWQREQQEFVIFVNDERERAQALRDGNTPSAHRLSPTRHRAEEAWVLLDVLAGPHVMVPREYHELRERARALRNARVDLAPPDLEPRRSHQHFAWNNPHDRQRLQAILDAELQPHVVVYASPLGTAATIRIMGVLAGGVLLLLMMVIAPLWVGVQLAQELHENTLQPLTGTALTARQLVLGLVAGPLAPVAIVAATMLGVTLLSAAVAGRMVPALGVVVMGTAMGAMLVGLAMLGALAVGRRRAPGIVGIGLLGLLGAAALAGAGAGAELDGRMLGLVAILPGAGPMHLLCEAFVPQAHLNGVQAQALDLRLGLATAGAVVLAALILRALERAVGGTHREGALRPVEAGVAAVVLAVLAVTATPPGSRIGEVFLAATALVLVPLQLVLLGRVPGGDTPARLRHVPLVRLLGEHAAWLGVVVIAALAVAGPPHVMRPGALVGVMHLGWAVMVTALVTLRVGALPSSIPVKLWLLVCLGVAMIEYVTGVVWCMDSPPAEMLFPMAAAHPVLGVIHVGLFLWIPVSLVRGLVTADRPALDLHARDDR